MVQYQLGIQVLDHAKKTYPSRHHELDHTDQEPIFSERPR